MSKHLVLTNVPPKAAEALRNKSAAYERLKDEVRTQTEDAINTVEVGGAALVVGFVEGRYPDKAEIEGVPLGVVVGAGCYFASFWAGKAYGNHLRALGKGAIAGSAYALGKEMGAERRSKAQGTAVSGDPAMFGAGAQVYPFHPRGAQVAAWR